MLFQVRCEVRCEVLCEMRYEVRHEVRYEMRYEVWCESAPHTSQTAKLLCCGFANIGWLRGVWIKNIIRSDCEPALL